MALADEGGNIGGRKKYEGDRKVLHESDIEAVFAAELNVGTLKKVQGRSIETTLW